MNDLFNPDDSSERLYKAGFLPVETRSGMPGAWWQRQEPFEEGRIGWRMYRRDEALAIVEREQKA